MVFVWDENKNRINRLKHRVSFETAARIFEDPNVVSYRDRVVDEEERWHSIGCAGGIAIQLVVHISKEQHGEEEIRIISARKASPRERALYHSHQ
ncbi:MAG: BrnT family toxin [Bryobacteraceae bacterium]